MLILHVNVHVKEAHIEAFKTATTQNARNSLQEPGIARFDILQHQNDPTRFILIEAYYTPQDPARHKETTHYQTWRDTVAPMMASPRQATKLTNIFPEKTAW